MTPNPPERTLVPGIAYPPTRAAALERLRGFLPHAGADYAARRSFDLSKGRDAGVSYLSPYLRRRLITEEEVVRAVLGRFAPSTAGKFVQEVFWRTYWKGWLEMRPSVWTAYRRDLAAAHDRVQTEDGLRADWAAACRGETGIDCFDAWAGELVSLGYLHNHARMWFASIWIFTLRLPWALGADFFLRQLMDGDPASNTLSWRWVAGLQTPGKTYLARPDNIARYTGGRFRPTGLAREAQPLDGPPPPPPGPAPGGERPDPERRTGLLVTDEDLSPGFLLAGLPAPVAVATLRATDELSPLDPAGHLGAGVDAMTDDALTRLAPADLRAAGPGAVDRLADWARTANLGQVITPHAPVGPTAEALDRLAAALSPHGIRLVRGLRGWDARAWPHATHGFFRFRKRIPELLAALDLRGP